MSVEACWIAQSSSRSLSVRCCTRRSDTPLNGCQMIARTVGLIESGAKVEHRKLGSMLEEFKLGCDVAQYDVGPDALFSNIDRIARPSLLSLGCAHGITPARGREGLLDVLS
ncbi:hypothetical protein J3R83DRAFT_2286 [Lanmaoa asiatica]|nr:hypothetical protein J3R83DRAFT_2286 [Lanmaoa asiatica]